MIAHTDRDQSERVGNLEMRIVIGERSPESDERWQRRSEAIAAWLTAEWQRKQRRRMAERN